MREISIVFTVGLPSIAPQVGRRLGQAGVDFFGINPPHVRTQRIRSSIAAVQSTPSKPPCIDPVGIQPLAGAVTSVPMDRGRAAYRSLPDRAAARAFRARGLRLS